MNEFSCKSCKTELTYNETRWTNGLCDQCDMEVEE